MTVEADTVPVLLLGFNRPDKLLRVIEPLRAIRPHRVFVAVDGPRPDRAGEADRCHETQRAAEAAIDWPCDKQFLFRPANLGCRAAVSGAISWAFEHVEELLIIEDDCVIDPSFVTMCRVLLDRHRDDARIWNIAAVNFQQGIHRGDGDYYASKYPHCWGWATWKRAWNQYSDDMQALSSCDDRHTDPRERDYWRLVFDKCVKNKVDSWAYRWTFRCWQQCGLTLLPNVNLVSNIGFDEEATHTVEQTGGSRMLQSLHAFNPPSSLAQDLEADAFTFAHTFCPSGSAVEGEIQEFIRKRLEQEAKNQARAEREQQKAAKAEEWKRRHPVRAWWRKLRGQH